MGGEVGRRALGFRGKVFGVILAAVALGAYAAAYLDSAPFLLGLSASAPLLVLVVGGGPFCLVAALALAARWERHAGALLWLGGAAAALGLSLGSGPHVLRYFAGLGLLVAPQVVAGSLLLLYGRGRERAAHETARRGGR